MKLKFCRGDGREISGGDGGIEPISGEEKDMRRKREKERFGLERLIGPLDEIKRRRRNERDKFCY